GGPAPAVRQRPAPARAGQSLRRRRPALHGPHQLRPDGPVQVPQPDGLPEDALSERLLLRQPGLAVPEGAHLLRRHARRPDAQGRRACHRPPLELDLMARHSLDFWLTSEDLPAPENRVTLDAQGSIVLSYAPNNEEAHRRLIAKLK